MNDFSRGGRKPEKRLWICDLKYTIICQKKREENHKTQRKESKKKKT